MKNAEQETELVGVDALLKRAAELKAAGWRLVQACATTMPDQFEITYSFDLAYQLLNLRVMVPKTAAKLPSLTPSFPPVFTYENEFQDLFGIKVEGLAPDFEGKFYRKAATAPFATVGPVVKGGA
jgi:ech hydrogenase subunit D